MDLKLKSNNLYRTGNILLDNSGERTLQRELINVEASADNKYHIVTRFDRLDTVAYQYYKDFVDDASKYWWVIADANNIENPLYLEPVIGKRIIIPDILKVLLTI